MKKIILFLSIVFSFLFVIPFVNIDAASSDIVFSDSGFPIGIYQSEVIDETYGYGYFIIGSYSVNFYFTVNTSEFHSGNELFFDDGVISIEDRTISWEVDGFYSLIFSSDFKSLTIIDYSYNHTNEALFSAYTFVRIDSTVTNAYGIFNGVYTSSSSDAEIVLTPEYFYLYYPGDGFTCSTGESLSDWYSVLEYLDDPGYLYLGDYQLTFSSDNKVISATFDGEVSIYNGDFTLVNSSEDEGLSITTILLSTSSAVVIAAVCVSSIFYLKNRKK